MEQGSKEWHDLRRSKIGASDAPVIMGVSPWKTPYQLWEEKLGMGQEVRDTESMKFGRETEQEARWCYEEHMGQEFFPKVVIHPDITYMMASLDGVNYFATKAVEIKCANAGDHELAKNGRIPDKYYPQLQHQLAVLNLEAMDYFSYHKGDGQIVRVERDEKYIQKLLEEEKKFWEKVQNLEEPELTDQDFIEQNEEWKSVAEQLCMAQESEKRLKKEISNLKSKLLSMSNERNSKCGSYIFSHYIRRSVDYSSIPELIGVDLEKYRKKSSIVWTLKKKDSN
ncbi:MAG: YqaJ viral recombinase family protein [Psychroflexus sp.]